MEKFNRVLRGYDPEEVNSFLDQVIARVEVMVEDIKQKNEKIAALEQDYATLKSQTEHYSKMEETLRQAIIMAEKTSEQIKLSAHQEREIITNDAKQNASRIINEALIRAEKIESDAQITKRNTILLKRRLKEILESQLEIIDDIEKIDV